MTKLRLAIAGLVAGVVTLVASPAMAYPDPVPGNLTGSAADGVVAPGERITLAGDFGGTDCNPWVATLKPSNEAPQVGKGTTFSVDFANPGDGKYVLSIVCTYDDGVTVGSASNTTALQSSYSTSGLAAATQTKTLNFAIQVGEDGPTPTPTTSPDGGALPNTGGSNLWLAVAAAALVVAGATTYTVRRRTA